MLPLLVSLLLAACGYGGSGEPSATPAPTFTPAPPTATPAPLAARVNGEPITLAAFEAEVERYLAASDGSGPDLATSQQVREAILSALIDRKLLAQGALEEGFIVDAGQVRSEIDRLIENEGRELFEAWLASNGYTTESFSLDLTDEMLAERMIAAIAGRVPQTMEQVHARHILVATRAEAEKMLTELDEGAAFEDLALLNSIDASSRLAGGDLGWFPVGYLLWPEVEEAAFALNPGETSGVVESELGYHIIQVIERGEHELSPDAFARMQKQAVEEWLQERRSASQIERLIEP